MSHGFSAQTPQTFKFAHFNGRIPHIRPTPVLRNINTQIAITVAGTVPEAIRFRLSDADGDSFGFVEDSGGRVDGDAAGHRRRGSVAGEDSQTRFVADVDMGAIAKPAASLLRLTTRDSPRRASLSACIGPISLRKAWGNRPSSQDAHCPIRPPTGTDECLALVH